MRYDNNAYQNYRQHSGQSQNTQSLSRRAINKMLKDTRHHKYTNKITMKQKHLRRFLNRH